MSMVEINRNAELRFNVYGGREDVVMADGRPIVKQVGSVLEVAIMDGENVAARYFLDDMASVREVACGLLAMGAVAFGVNQKS